MQKRLVFGALVTAGALVAGGIAGAQELEPAGDDHDATTTLWVLAMTEEGETEVTVDVDGGPDDGVLEPGDQNFFTETLYRTDRHHEPIGDAIGTAYIDCTFFRVELDETQQPVDAAAQCIGTLELPEGNIYLQTVFRFSDFAPDSEGLVGGVIGGDRQFAGATGEFHLHEEVGEGDEVRSIYRITLADAGGAEH